MHPPKEKIVFDTLPACSTRQQFDEWIAAARVCPPGPAGFCEDCHKEYQSKMIAVRRCSYPEVVFVNGDGQISQDVLRARIKAESDLAKNA